MTGDCEGALLEIIGHLGAILVQTIPSDDQIIIDHVRQAHDLAIALRRGSSDPGKAGGGQTAGGGGESAEKVSELAAPPYQPIDTAPKDGTEIIGIYFRPGDGMFKPNYYGPWTIAFERGKWRSSWNREEVVKYMSDFGTEYKEPDMGPTHWAPFPSTSSLSSQQGNCK